MATSINFDEMRTVLEAHNSLLRAKSYVQYDLGLMDGALDTLIGAALSLTVQYLHPIVNRNSADKPATLYHEPYVRQMRHFFCAVVDDVVVDDECSDAGPDPAFSRFTTQPPSALERRLHQALIEAYYAIYAEEQQARADRRNARKAERESEQGSKKKPKRATKSGGTKRKTSSR